MFTLTTKTPDISLMHEDESGINLNQNKHIPCAHEFNEKRVAGVKQEMDQDKYWPQLTI